MKTRKGSPENIKKLYLNSLSVIGIDHNEHDVRFVEDDWESPNLGAAGLGWEVWCDGMEIQLLDLRGDLKIFGLMRDIVLE